MSTSTPTTTYVISRSGTRHITGPLPSRYMARTRTLCDFHVRNDEANQCDATRECEFCALEQHAINVIGIDKWIARRRQ
jgi:hypothetical protein